ncbi:hypothetical protein CDAR_93221 [Caerostris darwini]|uniref:Uncharacterized protein n=1 Tax=Caerostris darwini TaxID=1538125 RepID=A0AAV4UWL7_9ARAC|nr:hypothetical protein CDAR_93221 [Caerostris darwini]
MSSRLRLLNQTYNLSDAMMDRDTSHSHLSPSSFYYKHHPSSWNRYILEKKGKRLRLAIKFAGTIKERMTDDRVWQPVIGQVMNGEAAYPGPAP